MKKNEFQHKFHASTLEEAEGTARQIVKYHQAESIREFPFAPVVVKGELYCQIKELDGAEFIKTTDGRSYADSLPKINESPATPFRQAGGDGEWLDDQF